MISVPELLSCLRRGEAGFIGLVASFAAFAVAAVILVVAPTTLIPEQGPPNREILSEALKTAESRDTYAVDATFKMSVDSLKGGDESVTFKMKGEYAGEDFSQSFNAQAGESEVFTDVNQRMVDGSLYIQDAADKSWYVIPKSFIEALAQETEGMDVAEQANMVETIKQLSDAFMVTGNSSAGPEINGKQTWNTTIRVKADPEKEENTMKVLLDGSRIELYSDRETLTPLRAQVNITIDSDKVTEMGASGAAVLTKASMSITADFNWNAKPKIKAPRQAQNLIEQAFGATEEDLDLAQMFGPQALLGA